MESIRQISNAPPWLQKQLSNTILQSAVLLELNGDRGETGQKSVAIKLLLQAQRLCVQR